MPPEPMLPASSPARRPEAAPAIADRTPDKIRAVRTLTESSDVTVTPGQERAVERGWWRLDGAPCPPGFHPSLLKDHVIVCGAIRELGSYTSTLRHLRQRALLTVGEDSRSGSMAMVASMPIVVLAEDDRERATLEWGLLGAKKKHLRDTYHVQESPSTEVGLRSAAASNGIRIAGGRDGWRAPAALPLLRESSQCE